MAKQVQTRLSGHALQLSRSGCQSLNVVAACKCGWSKRINRTVDSARVSYRTHIEIELIRARKLMQDTSYGKSMTAQEAA